MYRDYKIKIGIAPTRRDIPAEYFPDFTWVRNNKIKIVTKIKKLLTEIHDVEFIDIDWLNEEGMLVQTEDVAKVESYFRNAGVDAVFMPHCDFGQEEVVGKLGKALGKPFLLWGLRDEEPPADLTPRPSDTQCGLFASGKALLRFGVPFTYIENCWLDSPVLKEGLEKFVRVVSIMKDFTNMRVGQISVRPRPFLSVIINEDELLEKFGIEIVPINSAEILSVFRQTYSDKKSEMEEVVGETIKSVNCESMKDEDLHKIAALELSILDVARKYGLRSMASECWTIFRNEIGIPPCYVFGDLCEKGLPMSCETDVHGAITAAILAAAARGETPMFLADVTIRHPKNDNAELLWHCGPFPKSLAKDFSKRAMVDCHGQWELKGGDVTIARFDAIGGKYSIFAGHAVGTNGPGTHGNYLWIQTDDWPKWERKLVRGPYIHHVAGIHGKFIPILDEFCEYVGNLERDFIS